MLVFRYGTRLLVHLPNIRCVHLPTEFTTTLILADDLDGLADNIVEKTGNTVEKNASKVIENPSTTQKTTQKTTQENENTVEKIHLR